MKTIVLYIITLSFFNTLPAQEADDMARHIADKAFRTKCYETLDRDLNYKLSPDEIDSVESLDLSGLEIESLAGIEIFKNLRYLDCSDNELERLDLSANLNLFSVNCTENELTELKLGNNQNMTFLHCRSNKLRHLDLSTTPRLAEIDCEKNKLIKLNVSKLHAIGEVKCKNNPNLMLYVSEAFGKHLVEMKSSRENIGDDTQVIVLSRANLSTNNF